VGLLAAVGVGIALAGGGDVEGAEVGAAEGGGGDLAGGQADHRIETAVGGEAAQFAGVPDGQPDAAFGVEGETVGDAAGLGDGHEGAPTT